MIVKSLMSRGLVRTVQDVVDAWDEMAADDHGTENLGEVLALYLEALELIEGWRKSTWERLFAGEIDDVEGSGRQMQRTLDAAASVVPQLARIIALSQTKGLTVQGAEAFAAAAERLERVRKDFAGRWPFIDPAQVARCREQIERGEFQTGEEFLRELESNNPR